MTAEKVKDKLRRRYPATQRMGVRIVPGPWTCVEEWMNIDLLALCATQASRVPYGRIGHEIKVSRSDYRSELRNPGKRAEAVAACHEFYFVVPAGLLRDDEMPGGEATSGGDRMKEPRRMSKDHQRERYGLFAIGVLVMLISVDLLCRAVPRLDWLAAAEFTLAALGFAAAALFLAVANWSKENPNE